MWLSHLLLLFTTCFLSFVLYTALILCGARELFCGRSFHAELTSLGTAECWEDGLSVALNMKNEIICCKIRLPSAMF